MPELPEVETVCRALRPHLVGHRILTVQPRVGKLRSPLDPAALASACTGRVILDVRRRAKFIVLELEERWALLLHLGMTGAFRLEPAATPLQSHDRVTWELDDGNSLRFNDPRKFGAIEPLRLDTPGSEPPGLGKIGPEPLSPTFTGKWLHDHEKRRSCAVKAWIMQQELVAGVGNIYASEACFRAKIDPRRAAHSLTRPECDRLVREIRAVLAQAIDCGGTTIRDFRTVDGSEGRFDVELQAYGRDGDPCLRCGPAHLLQRVVLAGRSTFFCPHCQR